MKVIAESLSAANDELHKLIPAHGSRVAAGINFALLYVLCEALEYVDRKLVDGMLYGFAPVGDVPPGGRFRPVDEPHVEPFSTAENVELFDQVAADLAQRWRRARQKGVGSEEWVELSTLWHNVVGEDGEVSKGHMDGGEHGRGYTRRQIGTCTRIALAARAVFCGSGLSKGASFVGVMMGRGVGIINGLGCARLYIVLGLTFRRWWCVSLQSGSKTSAGLVRMTWRRLTGGF